MNEYEVVDVFTETPLQGNPVAVFHDAAHLTGDVMQQLANETKLSETTFVLPPTTDEAHVRVRIFTPRNELPFAGHPLLGTAIALAGDSSVDTLRVETDRGIVPFTFDRSGPIVQAAMRQPIPRLTPPFARATELLDALGAEGSWLPVEMYDIGPRHTFVALELEQLSQLLPDHRALSSFEDMAVNCFARESEHVWRMRMFSPAYGVVEDAATGSAAGPLAVHLVRHRQIDRGQPITIRQGVEMGRTSVMHSVARGAGPAPDEVVVGGAGVMVAEGAFVAVEEVVGAGALR